MQSTCVCNTYKMEYDKFNNLLGRESENLSKFVTDNILKLIVYLIRIMKINQLDLKHLCYNQTYMIIQMRIF